MTIYTVIEDFIHVAYSYEMKMNSYRSFGRWIVESCWHRHGHGHRHGHSCIGSSETSATPTSSSSSRLLVIVHVNQVCILSKRHLGLSGDRGG